MTQEELVNALHYRQAELQTLSDALGRDIVAALGQNKRLDDPEQAFRLRIRSVIDHVIGIMATALTHARELGVTTTATPYTKSTDLEENSYHSDHLAEAKLANHAGETEG